MIRGFLKIVSYFIYSWINLWKKIDSLYISYCAQEWVASLDINHFLNNTSDFYNENICVWLISLVGDYWFEYIVSNIKSRGFSLCVNSKNEKMNS